MKPIYTLFGLIVGCQLTFAQLQYFRPTSGYSGIFYGSAVDTDGNEIIVSSQSQISGNLPNNGKVYLFAKTNNGIEQQQVLFENSILRDDEFGNSISIHNNFIAAGATGDDTTASNAGAVYVYQKSGGTYAFLQRITAPDGMVNDYFGNYVKLYNNQLFIAANGVGQDTSFGNGAVYVYNFNGTSWQYAEKLTVPGSNALGRKIEVENETLVIASDEGGELLHTFYWDGTHWTFGNTIGQQNPFEGIQDFTLVNQQLFVLKAYDVPTQTVTVYDDSNGNWVNGTVLNLIDTDQIFNEISVNGDDMFVGSDQYILQMTRKFPVLHYQKNGLNWEPQTTLYSNGAEGLDDAFGSCIASKGDITIFGAPMEETFFSGNAYYLDMTLGNADFGKKPTNIYPNPTHDVVYFQNETPTQRIEVYSLTGKLLLSAEDHPKQIDMSRFDSGLYFVKITSPSAGQQTFKIVKN